MFCAFTRPRYQVSVYRTIGPLLIIYLHKINNNDFSFNDKLNKMVNIDTV